MKLLLKNIRSFADSHECSIRPLTILVGENSSGKSTFLAALAAVSDSVSFPGVTALNKAPYDLGTFDTIATYKGGRSGRAKEFSLGYQTEAGKSKEAVGVVATYCSDEGEARIKSLEMTAGNIKAELAWGRDGIKLKIRGLKGEGVVESSLSGELQQLSAMNLTALRALLPPAVIQSSNTERKDRRTAQGRAQLNYRLYHEVQETITKWRDAAPRATSIAPIRSEPKRTYDRLSDEYDPSGDHVPYVLARLLSQEEDPKQKKLHDALTHFGVDAGLFRDINVKRLGTKAGDPFQVQITVGGPSVNLSDVGYGVSQSLPIIVESILRATDARILLQQPEVHLHPRAQAALGTFFARLVADEHRHFVIETHSDYLIDRIRQEVANGSISHSDVGILFFDRPHIETDVSEITLDKNGNIQDAPPTYRKFFLEEELRLLNRAGEG